MPGSAGTPKSVLWCLAQRSARPVPARWEPVPLSPSIRGLGPGLGRPGQGLWDVQGDECMCECECVYI